MSLSEEEVAVHVAAIRAELAALPRWCRVWWSLRARLPSRAQREVGLLLRRAAAGGVLAPPDQSG